MEICGGCGGGWVDDGRVGVGGGGVGVGVGWGGPRYHTGGVWWVVGGGVHWMGPDICGSVGGWVGLFWEIWSNSCPDLNQEIKKKMEFASNFKFCPSW